MAMRSGQELASKKVTVTPNDRTRHCVVRVHNRFLVFTGGRAHALGCLGTRVDSARPRCPIFRRAVIVSTEWAGRSRI